MAGHSHFSPSNVEEHFEFTAEGRKRVIYAFLAGTIALIVGIFLLSRGDHDAAHAVVEHGGATGHEAVNAVAGQGIHESGCHALRRRGQTDFPPDRLQASAGRPAAAWQHAPRGWTTGHHGACGSDRQAQGRASGLSDTPGNTAFLGNTVTSLPPCHCEAVKYARTFWKTSLNLTPKPDG